VCVCVGNLSSECVIEKGDMNAEVVNFDDIVDQRVNERRNDIVCTYVCVCVCACVSFA